MQNLIILGASLVAIISISAIVAWLKLGRYTIKSREDALNWAQQLIPNFTNGIVVLDIHGHGALVKEDNGDIILIKTHGAHCAARRIARPAHFEKHGHRWNIDSGDKFFGQVALEFSETEQDTAASFLST